MDNYDNNELDMNIPPTLLIRQLTNSTEYSIECVIPDELMNKIEEKSQLSVLYNERSYLSIGYYNKNNRCMILNGRTPLDEYYVRGIPIMLVNYEDGRWVRHTISYQLPAVGSCVVNLSNNNRLTVYNENGQLVVEREY
jgi:hypothetical protein